MKILALTLGLLCIASTALAQKVEMRIELQDGTFFRMDVDSIVSMSTTPISYPKMRIMNLSRVHENEGEIALDSSYMDSIHFLRDANGMRMSLRSDFYQYYIAPIGGGVNGSSIVDTIKFGLYSFNPSVQSISWLGNPDPQQLISSDWHGSHIYASYPMHKYSLDQNYTVVSDSVFGWTGDLPLNIEVNKSGDRMVYCIPGLGYFPAGRLVEHNMTTGTFDTLPIGHLITAAKYVNASNDLIYYTKGGSDENQDPNPENAGYYYLDRSTGDTTLLLKHYPFNNDDEMVSGFDVNPAGTKFLFSKVNGLERAILMEFDLQTKQTEILPVDFPKVFARSLWVQYNNDDTKILYSLSDIAYNMSFNSFVGDSSEVGVISRSNYIRQILNVAPHNMRGFLVPYPRWSPDNTTICYGAAMFPYYKQLNYREPFHLYIKKL